MLVGTGASYDAARAGRTHQAPEDVALVAALPGWTIHVPGHAEELERLFRRALAGDGRVYIRMSEERTTRRVDGGGLTVLRRGVARRAARRRGRPDADPVLAATADLDVSVAYLATVRPFPHDGVRDALADGTDVVLVEPYLAGTSAAEIARRATRPAAPAARARRPERGVPPLRHGRGAPRRARPRRGRDRALARGLPSKPQSSAKSQPRSRAGSRRTSTPLAGGSRVRRTVLRPEIADRHRGAGLRPRPPARSGRLTPCLEARGMEARCS